MKGIYIDDQPIDVKALAKRLSGHGIEVEIMAPEEDLLALAGRIIEARPSVVLLDYRLDQYAVDAASSVRYRAAPLAQQLRDGGDRASNVEFPIVLISSEEKIRNLFRPEKTAHDLFDWKLIKNKVAAKADHSSKILYGLASGYQRLEACSGDYSGVQLFGIDDSLDYLIDHQELNIAMQEAEYPHIAARYLLTFIIRRQGLLIDRNHLHAVLGILPPEAMAVQALDTWLADCKYQGVFAECRDLWWLELVSEKFRSDFALSTNKLIAADRCEKLKEYLRIELEPAKDPWTGTSAYYPSFACACCLQPTALNHSLACFDSRLPSFVMRWRVCYKCVQMDRLQEKRNASEDDHPLQVDANDEVIARRLRSGELRPEAE